LRDKATNMMTQVIGKTDGRMICARHHRMYGIMTAQRGTNHVALVIGPILEVGRSKHGKTLAWARGRSKRRSDDLFG
jgi:hypothetical protein